MNLPTSNRRINVRRPLGTAVLLCLLVAGSFSSVGGGEKVVANDIAPFEVYVFMGDAAIWMGQSIRYTVYETTRVEARFLTATGEIIVLLPLGEQSPGQYTLPWDGTAMNSPMIGFYTFELYFGDDYAAKFSLVVTPPTPVS